MNRNSNPVFRNLQKNEATNTYVEQSTAASWKGIILKVVLLVVIAIAAGFGSFILPLEALIPLLIVGSIASFILVIVAMRSPRNAKWAAMVYALFQGITYGTITGIIELSLPGVGMMALATTLVIVLVMALLHATKLVRATPRLVRFVMGSLITIMLASVFFLILSIIPGDFLNTIGANIPLMIIVTGALAILGAIMLVIDFDNAKNLVDSGAPSVYEWQVALGLMVTMVWIYLQVLRFLYLVLGSRKN